MQIATLSDLSDPRIEMVAVVDRGTPPRILHPAYVQAVVHPCAGQTQTSRSSPDSSSSHHSPTTTYNNNSHKPSHASLSMSLAPSSHRNQAYYKAHHQSKASLIKRAAWESTFRAARSDGEGHLLTRVLHRDRGAVAFLQMEYGDLLDPGTRQVVGGVPDATILDARLGHTRKTGFELYRAP